MRIQFGAYALFSLALAGCGDGDVAPPAAAGTETAPAPAGLPDNILAERGGFVPEGIEFDSIRSRLLTGSLAEGTIFQLHPDGRVTPVITDPDLVSSVGIEVDEARDRLLVANADRNAFGGGTTGQAKLGVYDLGTGQRLAMVDLAASIPDLPAGATLFANDVTVADDGTIYVTETMQNIIFRVGADFTASVFHRFAPADGLGLNGIEYHPGGYLIVTGGATLYKVPVANPAGTTLVQVPETIEGQDGLVWMSNAWLAITSNSENRVVALTSDDDWATARIAGVAPFAIPGTTAARVGEDVFVVHPHFTDPDPPGAVRVVFE